MVFVFVFVFIIFIIFILFFLCRKMFLPGSNKFALHDNLKKEDSVCIVKFVARQHSSLTGIMDLINYCYSFQVVYMFRLCSLPLLFIQCVNFWKEIFFLFFADHGVYSNDICLFRTNILLDVSILNATK